jgi:hypothetical protein
MTRVKRRLLLAAAAALVFAAAAVALWPRHDAAKTTLVGATDGRILLIRVDGPPRWVRESRHQKPLGRFLSLLTGMPPNHLFPNNAPPPLPGPSELRFMGFWFVRGQYGTVATQLTRTPNVTDWSVYPFRIIGLPYWFIVLLAVVPPAVFVARRWRTARRRRSNACVHCGYDLRATPDRCPECGTSAKPQAAEGAAA